MKNIAIILLTVLVFSQCEKKDRSWNLPRTNVLDTSSINNDTMYIPLNGLVGWWPFTGKANDESGNGHHGKVNGATLTNDRNGKANSAYSFNGISNFISISSLDTLQYNPITYSFWFNPSTLCPTNSNECWKMILGRDNFGNTAQGVFTTLNHYSNGTNNLLLYYTGGDDARSGQTPITNNWYHVVFTYEVDNIVKWYLNGNLIKTDTLPQLSNANIPFNIGSGGGRFYWEGSVDDIGIWNRVLSLQEITTLFKAK